MIKNRKRAVAEIARTDRLRHARRIDSEHPPHRRPDGRSGIRGGSQAQQKRDQDIARGVARVADDVQFDDVVQRRGVFHAAEEAAFFSEENHL